MKLTRNKALLPSPSNISFKIENELIFPEDFHVAEKSSLTRNFIDCDGTIRIEKNINSHILNSDEYEHRFKALKLPHLIKLFEPKDFETKVEYQNETSGGSNQTSEKKYSILENKIIYCLAKVKCGFNDYQLLQSKEIHKQYS